ncbi:hypothetical protein [Henriciella sp.]|uniref:hypothetical protein n=1 Tax=Henriciella sp. TaxID=1968823 RepID=UPI0026252E80|nr:hypothetical protein [Henriciella sp.]
MSRPEASDTKSVAARLTRIPAYRKLAALAALAAGILGLGLIPGLGHPLGDKTEHVLAFSLLALAFRRSGTFLSRPVVCVLLLFAAAIALEILQGVFLRSRIASESDALASTVGIFAGFAASWTRGWKLAAAFAGIVLLAFSTNWMLNVGRYKLHDQIMELQAAKPDEAAQVFNRVRSPSSL